MATAPKRRKNNPVHFKFEWLLEEMARVRTHKFFLVDGPASRELRAAVEGSAYPLPPSYRQFVLRFGNAKLYRQSSYYYVTVYAGPREADSAHGERLVHFGRSGNSWAYFKESLLVPDNESPVFEWRYIGGLRKTADGFEEWLRTKCRAARKRYRRKEWLEIEKGPPPFTEHELAIVEARRKFRWRVVGIAGNGDLRFEVYNGSENTLPFLTLGVRGKNGEIDGGICLPVSSVGPGQTGVIERDCYKEWLPPENAVVFDKPEPGPEDRDRYWEFRAQAPQAVPP